MKKNAFTLLEVLVAITIIAVLAALMFPVMGQAVRRAKATVCISNLRQLQTAVLMYEADNGSFPENNIRNPPLRPYLGGVIPRCPMAPPESAPMAMTPDWDYIPYGYFPEGLPETPMKLDCMERRGPSWPLVLDLNHLKAQVAIVTGDPFCLIGRRGGSIERIPWAKWTAFTHAQLNGTVAKQYPCPKGDDIDNL